MQQRLRQYVTAIKKVMVARGLNPLHLKGVGKHAVNADFEQGLTPEDFVDAWWTNRDRFKPKAPDALMNLLMPNPPKQGPVV